MATLTRIAGSLYNAVGSVVTTGKITLQLQQDIISVDGTKVAPFTVSVDLSLTGGVFDKSVYATVGATPAGVAYLVEFDPNPTDTTKPANQKDGYWRNYWTVPNTTSTIPLGNFVSAHRGEPYSNYMPLGGSTTSPNFNDDIYLGLTPSSSNKRILANQSGGNLPALRWNASGTFWDLSLDGTSYVRIVTGTGTAGVLTKWSASGVLADSIISESGSTATINNTLSVPTITAAADLTLNPSTNIKTSKSLVPDTGYTRNMGSLTNKYLAIYASELWIDTLVQQNTAATVGGRIVVAPTTTLTADFSAVATTASLKHNQPVAGDVAYLETNGAVEYIGISSWPIVAVDTTSEWFEIAGDYTTLFTAGRTFVVRSSTGNNGTWTVSASSYNGGTVRTRITVTGNVTNSTADGHIAYLDAGPYVYPVTRNLDGSGANAWAAGDSLVNTGSTGNGFIDIYSVSGVLAGSGPTIVGNVRTGSTYNNLAPRWAVGNLNGLYGYAAETYGAAFGDPSGSWVKIDPTNGVRLGYNTTTKVQVDASGNAKFTDSISAGSSNDIVTMSAVDATYRLWVGHATAGSAPFRVTKTGDVTLTSVTITAGGVTLDSSGLYISPVSANGGGSYANVNAVRWTTSATYRTAIWRSDDTSASAVKSWNFENISDTNTVVNLTTHYTKANQPASTYAEAYTEHWCKSTDGFARFSSAGNDGGGNTYSAALILWGGVGGSSRRVLLGVGGAISRGASDYAWTMAGGIQVWSTGTLLVGPLLTQNTLGSTSDLAFGLRMLSSTYQQWHRSANLYYDEAATAWKLWDTGNHGVVARIAVPASSAAYWDIFGAASGSNPRTPIRVIYAQHDGLVGWYAAGVFAWTSKSTGTVYQAATDGFVTVWYDALTNGGTGDFGLQTDSSNPPTTYRVRKTMLNDYGSICSPVKKGDYYTVTVNTTGGTPTFSMFWVPMGTVG